MKGGIVGVWDTAEDLGYVIGPLVGGVVAEVYKDITLPFIFFGVLLLLLILTVAYMRTKASYSGLHK